MLKRSEREGTHWNIHFPLNVAYQNNKGNITPLVTIDLTLGFKISSTLTMPIKPKFSSDFLPSQIASIPSSTHSLTQTQLITQSQNTASIDCNYRIPAEVTHIDKSILLNWAEKAALQSFNFNAATIETELFKLQSCYTESGWTEFKTALDKSGNIEAIKAFHITMNSRLNGKIELIETQDNQWEIKLPLMVNWQSDKEEMTQLLTVDLTVGRKNNGDLGIMQIIATIAGSTSFKPYKILGPNPRQFAKHLIALSD